ncbi:hypothetical protein N7471_012485 [Penicillium samsonianum]|uniref:uncharacterized protein n=1 Tax=Penicillium samsonianum TaxID=1882272 RepID=UPI002547E158|nr:uncharacterized protein N7471_012485 [Penicillium samsonianum]KAJ6125168.1 hypothetical protein N7471_012485 [Penicillium samsonianum]
MALSWKISLTATWSVLWISVQHRSSRDFPFSHTLGAYHSTSLYQLAQTPRSSLSWVYNNSSFRNCIVLKVLCVLCVLCTLLYANSTVNIDPSTPLRCRDSDASQ